jgi:hypothetical protein
MEEGTEAKREGRRRAILKATVFTSVRMDLAG